MLVTIAGEAAARQRAVHVELAATEAIAASHLAIPMSPVLGPDQAAEVVDAVRAFAGALA